MCGGGPRHALLPCCGLIAAGHAHRRGVASAWLTPHPHPSPLILTPHPTPNPNPSPQGGGSASGWLKTDVPGHARGTATVAERTVNLGNLSSPAECSLPQPSSYTSFLAGLGAEEVPPAGANSRRRSETHDGRGDSRNGSRSGSRNGSRPVSRSGSRTDLVDVTAARLPRDWNPPARRPHASLYPPLSSVPAP